MDERRRGYGRFVGVAELILCLGWYVDRATGKNHLIYPCFQMHYWLRTIFPLFKNFEIVGARGWLGFYMGVLRRKIRRNKWMVAALAAWLGWYVMKEKLSRGG